MAGGKEWGQRTADGRYAICYNPIETQPYRYPLIAITGSASLPYPIATTPPSPPVCLWGKCTAADEV